MPDQRTLYYAHDPMCSWCYAFRPLWKAIQNELPNDINVQYVLGGLAPDTDTPMPEQMQSSLINTWKRISQTVPGTEFNFDFWTQNQPRRSTYPSCRAVLATRMQDSDKELTIIESIQNAYYQQARNPSDDETLIDIAGELGLDTERFAHDLNSADTQQKLDDEIKFSHSIGGDSFPSLILQNGEDDELLMLSYTDKTKILRQL